MATSISDALRKEADCDVTHICLKEEEPQEGFPAIGFHVEDPEMEWYE